MTPTVGNDGGRARRRPARDWLVNLVDPWLDWLVDLVDRWLARHQLLVGACVTTVPLTFGAAFLVGVGGSVVEVVRCAGILLDWWGGHPHWYAVICVVVGIVSWVKLGSGEVGELVETLLSGLFITTGGVLTVAGWVGWHAAMVVIGMAICAIACLATVIFRSEQAEGRQIRLITMPERDIAGPLPAVGLPAASPAPLVPGQARARDRTDDVPEAVQPSPAVPPGSPGAQRPATRADRRDAPERDESRYFEPFAVWITTFLAWAVGTLWLYDKGLLSASWLPHGLFWYLLLLVVPPSLTIFPLGGSHSAPVRRLRAWLGVGSFVALGPGVVVGPLIGVIVGVAWALLHRGGFWSGFLHGSATYGAGLVLGVQLAAVVAGLVSLVAWDAAVPVWVIIDAGTFGTVFGLRHGILVGVLAAFCGFFFGAASSEFLTDEMPDDD